jgi:glucosylceramidase
MRSFLLAVVLAGCSSSPATSSVEPDGGGSSVDSGANSLDAGTDASPVGHDASTLDAAEPPAPPAAYITTDDLSEALAVVPITMGDSGRADVTVTIDSSTTYQSILGFGASITDSSSYVMTKYLSATALARLLTQLFDPTQGVGLSFLRQPMGASDFSSVGNFSYDDGSSDSTLTSFNIAQDMKATLPVLKQVLGVSPDIFIMATPWSPPAWMKLNGSMNGTGGGSGNAGLSGSAYAPFGNYFVKFIQAYAAESVPIGAITPQNEPLNGAAAYPGMDLDAPSELALIAQDIGPDFATAGISTFIWAYDHNWDVESYPAQIMGDATAGGFTEGAAFHCYSGDASAMTTFHQAFPMKSVYMTECSGGDWQGDPFANTIDLIIDSTSNWARAISLWNMALDENKGPQNDGCNDCRGVVTVNSQSGDVTYNADYYALGHFSKFVHRGAMRIASTSSDTSLGAVAFANVDGRIAVVAHNSGSSTMVVRVGTGASAMNVSVPANAGVTFSFAP